MIQGSPMSKDDLLCSKYKNTNRNFQVYRGFRLPSLKLLLEYVFSGHVIQIEHNHKDLQFDIYLSKFHKETKVEIDPLEVEGFRKFFGPGFNIILWLPIQ